ncbi:MAG: hypothetical protein M3439_07220, partial [Chloroflexota bacterium]|nr:hypothetical protein [Chloroflexota bacterium]
TDPLAGAMAGLARGGHRLVLVTIDEVTPPPIRGLVTFKVDSDRVAGPRPPRRRYARQLHPTHPAVATAVAEGD